MRLPFVLRHGAARVLGRIPLRVRAGANRGLRWSLASAGRGAVAGTFERDRMEAIARLLRPGDCVWDIGAHKGYVSLLAARLTGDDGQVYACEPAPANLEFLRRHIAWNGARNVQVIAAAVSDSEGTARFGGPGSSITYRLGQGEHMVVVRTVNGMLAEGRRRPDVLKIDVEGNEAHVLAGARGALHDGAIALVAIHSRSCYDAVREELRGREFRIYHAPQLARNVNGSSWRADPDLLAVGRSRDLTPEELGEFTPA